jgi:hypothetical protein
MIRFTGQPKSFRCRTRLCGSTDKKPGPTGIAGVCRSKFHSHIGVDFHRMRKCWSTAIATLVRIWGHRWGVPLKILSPHWRAFSPHTQVLVDSDHQNVVNPFLPVKVWVVQSSEGPKVCMLSRMNHDVGESQTGHFRSSPQADINISENGRAQQSKS